MVVSQLPAGVRKRTPPFEAVGAAAEEEERRRGRGRTGPTGRSELTGQARPLAELPHLTLGGTAYWAEGVTPQVSQVDWPQPPPP